MEQGSFPQRFRDDTDALRTMLRGARARALYPIAFGGVVSHGVLRLTEFFGTTTNGLRELSVYPGVGAGGIALRECGLVAISDYRNAPTISHDYDGPVLAEGIRSVMAAPVVVNGVPRMVAYAATRSSVVWGDQARDEFHAAVRELGREIAVRDETDRRIALMQAAAAERELTLTRTVVEMAVELRELASVTAEESVAARLRDAALRLDGSARPFDAATARLTRRETEVLKLVGYGLPYADVAHELGLSPATVKSYMKSTTAKLGARSRHHAVVEAQRQGLLDGFPRVR